MSEQEANLSQSNFFGHPIGLRTLFFTELWERMSYYGMRGLLVLYMTIGVVGNPGLGWSNVEANAIYGIYAGMVYRCLLGLVFTLLFGLNYLPMLFRKDKKTLNDILSKTFLVKV